MFDQNSIQTVGKDRQEALIAWRENQRLLARLPKQEPIVLSASRRAVNALIHKLETLGHAEPASQAPHDTVRRGA
ncbi:MAG: hypothetical protein CL610_28530 [Anaerolineaceae bacterium]|nr:hypothetical protein [Anaerolineaceae bacterium]